MLFTQFSPCAYSEVATIHVWAASTIKATSWYTSCVQVYYVTNYCLRYSNYCFSLSASSCIVWSSVNTLHNSLLRILLFLCMKHCLGLAEQVWLSGHDRNNDLLNDLMQMLMWVGRQNSNGVFKVAIPPGPARSLPVVWLWDNNIFLSALLMP